MVPQSYSSRKLTNLWKSLLNNFLVKQTKCTLKKITLDSIGIWNSLTIFTLIKTYSIVFGSKYWLFTLIITFFQNFSVCGKCSRLAQLYHKLYHQKHKMFTICAEVVDSRKKNSPGLDTTRMLNELLADDQWLETVMIIF